MSSSYRDLPARSGVEPAAARERYKERLRAQRKIVKVDEQTDLESVDPRYEFVGCLTAGSFAWGSAERIASARPRA